MKLTLSDEIISSEDLKSTIEELRAYKAYLRHNQVALKAGAHHQQDGPQLSTSARELISQTKDNGLRSLEQLIDALEDMFKRAPKLRIVLAASPTRKIKQQLAGWIRHNVSDLVLIDFRYDSAILGGMVVVIGSHIYDWSLRRQITEAKDKLQGVIAHV